MDGTYEAENRDNEDNKDEQIVQIKGNKLKCRAFKQEISRLASSLALVSPNKGMTM